jgi:hypothetical protein
MVNKIWKVNNNMPANKAFDAPIPGQSLTRSPGSRPYEQPPRFSDPEEATVAMLDGMMNKKSGAAIAVALEKGIPATVLATGILKGGVVNGTWSTDTAMLISKRTLGAVVALGHRAGVKNIIYAPDQANPAEELLAYNGITNDRDVTRGPDQAPAQEPISKDMGEDITTGGPYPEGISQGMDEDITRMPERVSPPERPQPGKDEVVDGPWSMQPTR